MFIRVLIFFSFSAVLSCDFSNADHERAGTENERSAIEVLNEQVSQSPNDPSLYIERARQYYKMEGYDQAIDDLKHAITLDSTKLESYYLLAEIYLQYYQSKKALNTMEQAVQVAPDDIDVRLRLAEYQLILKQYSDALITANTILQKDPQHDRVFFIRGMIFREQQMDSLAIRNFQRAVDLNPEMVEAFVVLGDLHAKKNDPLALQYYDNAIRADAESIIPLHSKAFYLQNNDQVFEAMQIYEDIITKDENYLAAYLNLGILYMDADSLAKALDYTERAINTDPESANAYYLKGTILQQMGNNREALTNFEQALTLDDKFHEARKAIEDVRQAIQ